MIKATIFFDNKIASALNPKQFVEDYYLSKLGKEEAVVIEVEQGDWKILKK